MAVIEENGSEAHSMLFLEGIIMYKYAVDGLIATKKRVNF